MATWLKRQRAVYFDNAPSRKDFRVQLRSSRTLFQWGIFLLLFMLVAYVFYNGAGSSNGEKISLQNAQERLHDFYGVMLGLLGGLVALISPAIGASSVVVERQRRFLDLLLASPMSGNYYLTGKLMSTYRNIWMLLILSLPVVAVGAVMGGETYADVFKAFLAISLDGVVLSCISISISAGAQKLPSALLLSYLCTFAVIICSTGIVAGMSIGRHGAGAYEMSVLGMFSPFTASSMVETTTNIGGLEIPNWLLFIPLTALAVQVCILGGVSALATKPVRATVWFRVLALPLVGWLGFTLVDSTRLGRGGGSAGQDLVIPLLILGFVVPFVSCFVADGPIKFTYDGRPKIKNTFLALPSGSIFYVEVLILAAYAGGLAGLAAEGDWHSAGAFSCYFAWMAGLYMLIWSVCRMTSQFAGTLASARGLATIFVTLGLTIASIAGEAVSSSKPDVSPMAVLSANHPIRAVIWGGVFAGLALVLSLIKAPKFFNSIGSYG